MQELSATQEKWFELFDRLQRNSEYRREIAPPFVSVPPAAQRSILYVGQATAKDGCWENTPRGTSKERLRQGRNYTRKFLREEAKGLSRFWDFAENLNSMAAGKWNSEGAADFRHIAWTNLFKIGEVSRNPRSGLRSIQKSLAIETLRLEIKSYKPHLICFATGDFGDDILGETICDPEHRLWDKRLTRQGLWRRRAKGELPAIVWIGHPGRVSNAFHHLWLKRVEEFLPN